MGVERTVIAGQAPQRQGGGVALSTRSVGTLYYDGVAIQMNDRTLAHVKVAIVQKMRRAESFTFSWVHTGGAVPGRSTIWINPAIPIRFEFVNPVQPMLNTRWIESILRSASTTGGIVLTEEMLESGPPDPSIG